MRNLNLLSRIPQRGFSLIELMIAVTIGLLITLALSTLYLNITRNNSELAKVNSQIESGRFALQLLETDLVHAGFWGELSPAAATAVPADPCLAVASWDAAFKANTLGMPVMGFAAVSSLANCFASPNLASTPTVLGSSDILMVRHANTCVTGAGCEGDTLANPDDGPHIQVSGCTASIEPSFVIDSESAATFTLRDKNCTTIAARRKVVTNIYYLATSNGQPTLMRVSMIDGVYQNAQPLIEGIEAMRFEYGIDSAGNDGVPDSYLSAPPTTLAQLGNIVAVKAHVLARSLEKSPGYTDGKTYQLGSTSYAVPPADTGYKRHVFSTTIRLVNPSGRREIP